MMPTFFNQSCRVARKRHTCCECSADIAPGDTYEYTAGCWDNFEVFKTCIECVMAREWLTNEKSRVTDTYGPAIFHFCQLRYELVDYTVEWEPGPHLSAIAMRLRQEMADRNNRAIAARKAA